MEGGRRGVWEEEEGQDQQPLRLAAHRSCHSWEGREGREEECRKGGGNPMRHTELRQYEGNASQHRESLSISITLSLPPSSVSEA